MKKNISDIADKIHLLWFHDYCDGKGYVNCTKITLHNFCESTEIELSNFKENTHCIVNHEYAIIDSIDVIGKYRSERKRVFTSKNK